MAKGLVVLIEDSTICGKVIRFKRPTGNLWTGKHIDAHPTGRKNGGVFVVSGKDLKVSPVVEVYQGVLRSLGAMATTD